MNNFEIIQELLVQDFEEITSAKRSTKARHFKHQAMINHVSVKLGANPTTPMSTNPLVIHPSDLAKLRSAGGDLAAIANAAGPAKGSSLLYDRVEGGALSIQGRTVLSLMLDCLLGRSQQVDPVSSIAPLPPQRNVVTAPEYFSNVDAGSYARALHSLGDQIGQAQRQMLIGHAKHPDKSLSTASIAHLAGFEGTSTGNLLYGKLAGLLAEVLGHEDEGQHDKLWAIAVLSEGRDAHGQQLWTMRPALAQALAQIGWLSSDSADPLRFAKAAAQAEIEHDPQYQSVDATTREQLVQARIGQGGYRDKLLALWGDSCAVTQCALSEVLIASHAKPWAESSNTERLDPFNGLLLTASIDRLFDKGLISFTDDGSLLRKPWLADADIGALGLKPTARLRQVQDRHRPYLAFHRAKHGFNA